MTKRHDKRRGATQEEQLLEAGLFDDNLPDVSNEDESIISPMMGYCAGCGIDIPEEAAYCDSCIRTGDS